VIRVEVETKDYSRDFLRSLTPRLAQVVNKAAHDLEAQAKANIQTGPKTGRVYKRGKKKHQASAPGESPATDTGFLANNIRVQANGSLTAYVVATQEYAAALEFGTAKMAARPFMAPAADKVAPVFEAAVAVVLEDGASDAG